MMSGAALLKYHRSQGKVDDLLKENLITASCIGENVICFGTETGNIFCLDIVNQDLKKFKAFDCSIIHLTVDSSGSCIAGCSVNGKVCVRYLNGTDDDREATSYLSLKDAATTVCIEDNKATATYPKDRTYIIGTDTGKLIHHKPRLKQKDNYLFEGSMPSQESYYTHSAAVITAAWKGKVVAWADETHVRLMDISTQSAICYLPVPSGLSMFSTTATPSKSKSTAVLDCPCCLFWESASQLLIGWGDLLRHVELSNGENDRNARNSMESSTFRSNQITARVVSEWNADCIICSVASFDVNHIALIGLVPPLPPMGGSGSNKDSTCMYPELQLLSRRTGKCISSDILPIQGVDVSCCRGPRDFHLLSTYQNASRKKDYRKWEVFEAMECRGRDRGFAPLMFVVSTHDMVVARVCDATDRIAAALMAFDLKGAVECALVDRNSLQHYNLNDLISLYIEDLLDNDRPDDAAAECARLLGAEEMLWVSWINKFETQNILSSLSMYLPTSLPRLQNGIYEHVLEVLLATDTCAFAEAVRRWVLAAANFSAECSPLFDYEALINTISARFMTDKRHIDSYCLEAQAILYNCLGNGEKALILYLDVQIQQTIEENDFKKNMLETTKSLPGSSNKRDFYIAFEIIENNCLFDIVKEKLYNLVLLSRAGAGRMLVKHFDKFPAASVVRQLRRDKSCLLWYLHLLFITIPDVYNSQDFAELHIMQVSLYAELTISDAVMTGENDYQKQLEDEEEFSDTVNDVTGFRYNTHQPPPLMRRIPKKPKQTDDLMTFLQTSNFIHWELALRDCEKTSPPLYSEIIYILTRMGHKKEALSLLLNKIGDVDRVVAFVEIHDRNLWNDVIEYSVYHPMFLAQLLDKIGACDINPIALLSKIPTKASIVYLRQRLHRIVAQYEFQAYLTAKCGDILKTDTLTLLRNLNQGQRKAMKVDSQSRCCICSKPLFMAPGSSVASQSEISQYRRLDTQVWGKAQRSAGEAANASNTGVVVFSNRNTFHRSCYDFMYDTHRPMDDA